MNCQDYHDYLQRFLDGERPAAEASLDEHLAQCADCRGWQVAVVRLASGLDQLSSPTPPVGLTDRIVTQMLAEHRQRRTWQRQLAVMALAASALVVGLGGYRWWFRTANGESTPPDAALTQGLQTPDPRRPFASAMTLRDSVAEVGTLVTSLGWRTVDQSRPLWPLLVPPGWDELSFEEPVGPPAQGLLDAGQGIATGLEPVADSARRAFELFRREVPPLAVPEKQG
jgi:hypothetical protein